MPKRRAESRGPAGRVPAPGRAARPGSAPARGEARASRELRRENRELAGQIRGLCEQQRSLEQTRAQYADLFDFAPVTYALLDAIGMVVAVNLAACRLLNVHRAHLIGHPVLGFVEPSDRREFLEHLRRCRSGQGVVESEIRLVALGEGPVTCRLYSKRARLDGNDVFPTVIIDQSERLALDLARLAAERRRDEAERAAGAARAASAAKDRFLNTVSHELRTPLTPALFAASRLAAWDDIPDEARTLAATVQRNIEYEARLIDDLLEVARISRERISLELQIIDVHEVIADAVRICGPLAASRDVALAAHLVATSHHARADGARLRQVFWNLLNNAIKFTDAGGRVMVRTANASDAVIRVSIRDSGTGMEPHVLQNLFAPFDQGFQGRESRAGLGLGLAICKGLVGAHGGQISAASDGPGRGSTFAVDLATSPAPQPEEAGPARPERDAAPDEDAEPAPRVLVIEDDRDSREMLALFLSQSGYGVEAVSSLGAGMTRLDDNWDIVVSDIGLPDGSGLEVARRASRLPHRPRRLIALTGYGSSDDVRASRQAGFDDHVVKPVDLDGLLSTLNGARTKSR